MSVQWVYVCVVIIWSSTPLAIKTSNDTLTPWASLSLRIAIAVLLAFLCSLWFSRNNILQRKHLLLYTAAAVSLWPNMQLVYLASSYIPSGLISILFALNPFVMGILAWLVLKEPLSRRKLIGLFIALLGLILVFIDQVHVDDKAYIGVLLMLASCLLFSGSSIWVKCLSVKNAVPPLEQTLGSMTVALPFLLLSWWVFDGQVPVSLSANSFWSVLYLAVIGSLVGFIAFYTILEKMTVSSVALIPLITPGIAVLLGNLLAGESVSANTLLGGFLIITALGVHQGNLIKNIFNKKGS